MTRLALALLLLSACTGTVSVPGTENAEHMRVSETKTDGLQHVVLLIDQAWAPEQVTAIQQGIGVWLNVTGSWVEFDTRRTDCSLETRGCLSPTSAAQLSTYADPATPGGSVVGYALDCGSMALEEDYDGQALALDTAHELGHQLGLEHSDQGVMSPVLGEGGFEVTQASLDRLVLGGYR